MNVQAFFTLVGKMRQAQIDYYFARRQPDTNKAKACLIAAKELEKAVDAVIKEDRLELDATIEVFLNKEDKEKFLQYRLDNLLVPRPNDEQGEQGKL